MKTLEYGLALVCAMAQAAFFIDNRAAAADLGPQPFGGFTRPIAYNWTGFYIGGSAGGHWAKDDVTIGSIGTNGSISSTSLEPRGFIAGLQTGYNWQVGNVVVGIELDGNWLDGSVSRSVSALGAPFNAADTINQTTKPEFLTTVRPRIGLAFDRLLVYATGGLAFGTIKTTDAFSPAAGPAVFSTTHDKTLTGETIGGGLEYAFLDNWTAKVEYLYTSFGGFDTVIPRSSNAITVHHNYSDNIVRVGLNYRFFGPVYWKY